MNYLKKHVLKLLIISAVVLNILLVTPVISYASPFNQACTSGSVTDGRNVGSSTLCSDNPTSNPLVGPDGLLIKVVNVVSIIAGVTAVIMIIISGMQFVLANGEAKRVESARNTIIFSVIGLIVIVLARFIIEFVVSRIT